MEKAKSASSRLVLRIALRDIEPTIWRRIAVAEDITLAQLHRAIQEAFGWQDCHLHEFHVGRERFGRPDYDEPFSSDESPLHDERKAMLGKALGSCKALSYWYDFGDDWWHDIAVEGREVASASGPRVLLLDGERSGPPEDCGGPYGYSQLLAALQNPKHREHAEMVEWAGDYDPERFDLEAAKRRVAGVLRAGTSRSKNGITK